jgi:hypothetical protein
MWSIFKKREQSKEISELTNRVVTLEYEIAYLRDKVLKKIRGQKTIDKEEEEVSQEQLNNMDMSEVQRNMLGFK